jgi:serine protease Do
MNHSVKNQFSGFFSQLVVVCLLAVFIIIAVVAMYSTSRMPSELEWIGMTVKPLETGTAAALGIPSNVGGVIVEEVDGVAARAGVRDGDVLQGINGKPVGDMADFSELAGKTDLSKAGAQLVVNRRGLQIPILAYPSAAVIQGRGQTTPRGIAQAPAAIDRRWLGIDAETLAAGDARELGIPAGVAGVLIDGVSRGSLAQQAGLISSDVIVSVNDQRVDSTAGLWSTLAGLNGDPVEFGVYRNGQLMSVVLPTVLGTVAGGFPGRMGGQGLGPGGVLVCSNCGTKVTHQRGVPCYAVPCPSCGTQMIRVQ